MPSTPASSTPAVTRRALIGPVLGRIRCTLAAWGPAITAALATQHGWCLADGLWYPNLGDVEPTGMPGTAWRP